MSLTSINLLNCLYYIFGFSRLVRGGNRSQYSNRSGFTVEERLWVVVTTNGRATVGNAQSGGPATNDGDRMIRGIADPKGDLEKTDALAPNAAMALTDGRRFAAQ